MKTMKINGVDVAKGGNLKDYLDTYYSLKSSLKED